MNKWVKLAAAMAALAMAVPGNAATQIINISAADGNGTTVGLAAGNYTVQFIGTAQGGAYDGYSPWSSTTGCDGAGMNCTTGFIEVLAIDFGHGVDNFNRVDGFQHGVLGVPGNNQIFATGAQAIANIQTAPIVRAALPQASDANAYSPTTNPISFSLGGGQNVNFYILDNPYSDNRGGISILLDDGMAPTGGVPEPATWGMMILGFGMIGGTMRRRRPVIARSQTA